MTKNRLEAFSDGVFAIVITLLILDVRFPADKPLTLETLWGVAPHLWAFVLSFVIVGVYWVSHHNMLHFIRQVDRQLLWLNLTLLLLVVFIPFPAALLGQHADSELAVALYGINLMLVYAAAIALAHWYVPVGLILFAAVPVFFILPNPFIDRRLRSAMGAPPVPAGGGGE